MNHRCHGRITVDSFQGRVEKSDMSSHTKAVHQLVSVLRLDDAVGNIVLELQRRLRGWGYESTLFARTDEQSRSLATAPERYPQIADNRSVLLIHHGFESRLVPLIRRAPGRKAILYYDITPARFFERFDGQIAASCSAGRNELLELAPVCERAYALSRFSAEELSDAGFANVSILPLPLVPPALETAPDSAWASRFKDGCFNVLFVGRAVPNKCLEDLLSVFAVFQRLYQPKSRLLIAGEFPLESAYARWLNATRARLRAQRIHFLGRLRTSQLSACYQVSHAYLSMSQHEGLGLPLLEAMHRQIPVVAYGAAAVPETMGGAGLVTMTRAPLEVAKLLAVLDRTPALRKRIVDRQNLRVAAVLPDPEGSALRRALEPLLDASAPRTKGLHLAREATLGDSKQGGHRHAS
jgi:glycosyltransferase involved in cell wall biosynthesis